MSNYLKKKAEWINLYNETKLKLIARGCEKFVTLSEDMYTEFSQKDGTVTCEHSTKGVHLDLKMTLLSLMSMIDINPSIGYWRMYWCDTCVDHNPEHPFHCEIVRSK